MISSFREKYRFLSNFHSVWIVYEDVAYPTSEHAYQAAKTLDKQQRNLMSRYPTPGLAKRASKTLNIRPDWEEVREDIMYRILKIKFSIPHLRQKLIDTGNQELIEGNYWHDNFWGVCSCEKCGGVGMNTLGKLLMKVRSEL